MNLSETLQNLSESGNLRSIPADRMADTETVDFSSNDYLGFGNLTVGDLSDEYPELLTARMTSSASRLLAGDQRHYLELESLLEKKYGRNVLMFNSGYHINTGILPAIADRSTLILGDKLIHASLIDGLILSRCDFRRFPHNDLDALERMVAEAPEKYSRIIVIVESVYSMDGDSPDLERLIEIKRLYPHVMLYVDEAHAFGVEGPQGLGMVAATSAPDEFDIVIATLGKAAASFGAFAVTSDEIKRFLVNRSRSFIFSTVFPPAQAVWTRAILHKIFAADDRRRHLKTLGVRLHTALEAASGKATPTPSHIQALITGDASKAVSLSHRLRERGLVVLPIRTPTVPAGTERLRISLSASMTEADIEKLSNALR